MKITRRQLRKIIKESINKIRVDAGMKEVDFAAFQDMARHFGKEIHHRRTSRDSGHDEIFFDIPKGKFTLKHIYNPSLGSFFLRYSFVPSDGSQPIKNKSISSKEEMYKVVESYLKPKGPDGKPIIHGIT